MKAFKYIIILILILIVGGAIYFSLQDGGIEENKEIIVDAPTPLVYEYISDYKNWDTWNPNVPAQISGEQITNDVDAQIPYSYDKNENGTLTIQSLDSLSNASFIFNSDDVKDLDFSIILKPTEDNKTKLIASIKGERSLENKIWTTILGDEISDEIIPALMNPIVSIGSSLKELMSKKVVEAPFKTTISGGYHLYITQSTNLGNVESLKDQLESTIMYYMSARNITATGNTKVFYETKDLNNNLALITVGIPVGEKIITEVNSQVLCGFKESEDVIKTTLKGDTQFLDEAWKKGSEFILLNGLTRKESPVFEVYRVKMSDVYNPAEAVTDVYIPVK